MAAAEALRRASLRTIAAQSGFPEGGTSMPADDLIATSYTAQAAFSERVHAVAPDQWQLGTRTALRTVADLVGHLVDEDRWAAPLWLGWTWTPPGPWWPGWDRQAGTKLPSSARGTGPRPPQPRRSAPTAR